MNKQTNKRGCGSQADHGAPTMSVETPCFDYFIFGEEGIEK